MTRLIHIYILIFITAACSLDNGDKSNLLRDSNHTLKSTVVIPTEIPGDQIGSGWSQIALGRGWNAVSNTISGTCAFQGPSEVSEEFPEGVTDYIDNEILSGILSSELKIRKDVNSQQMSNLLTGDVDGSVGFLTGSVDGHLGMVKSLASNSQSINYVIGGTYHLGSKVFPVAEKKHFTKFGKENSLLGADRALRGCGTHFVVQENYGAKFYAVLKIDTSSSKDKDEVSGSITSNTGKIGFDANGSFDKFNERFKNKITVKLQIIQLGGDFRDTLSKLIPSSEGSKSIIECTTSTLDKCFDAFNNIANFFSSDFPNQFTRSVDGKEELNPKKLKKVSVTAIPYGTIYSGRLGDGAGCEGQSEDCKPLYKVLNNIRKDLENSYFRLSDDHGRSEYLFANKLSLLNERPDWKKGLVNLNLQLKSLLATYLSAIENCYKTANEASCSEGAYYATKKQTDVNLNLALLNLPTDSFEFYCEKLKTPVNLDQGQNELISHIANTIIRTNSIPQSSSCRILDKLAYTVEYIEFNEFSDLVDLSVLTTLPNLKNLTIIGTNISDIDWLTKLNLLERLELSYNGLSGFTHLVALKNLRTLIIKGNYVNDDAVKEISNLPILTELVISNGLTTSSLCPLFAGETNLQLLDVRENSITKDQFTCEQAPSSAFRVFYLDPVPGFDPESECPAERCIAEGSL